MNAYNIVKKDLRKTIITAMNLNIIVNPQKYTENGITLSSQYSFFRSQEEYLSEYAHSYEENKYLCALTDGSYFQVNYEFEKKSKNKVYIKKLNLCYLPAIHNHKMIHSYVRLDFEPESDNSFFHSQAHLHLGFDNDIRIPVDEVLLFSEFFEMILFFFYNDKLRLWNSCLNIGHTVSKNEGRFTKQGVLPTELVNYFFFHQKNHLPHQI